jgi:hypothetical protein
MTRARPLALLACLHCTSTSPTSEPAAKAPTPAIAPNPIDGDEFLIGVLSQSGAEVCDATGERRWEGVVPVIGWTGVTLPADADSLMDRPVVARGTVGGEPPQWPPRTGTTEPCPPQQMRSDWIDSPRGMKMRRTDSPAPLSHFTVQELRPLAELTVRNVDGALAIDFRNPLPVELRDVVLRMHYEGCHGKPGTATRDENVGNLAVGAGTRASFPGVVEAERGPGRLEPHGAFSLQIIARAEHAHIDLDVRISSFELGNRCPES